MNPIAMSIPKTQTVNPKCCFSLTRVADPRFRVENEKYKSKHFVIPQNIKAIKDEMRLSQDSVSGYCDA